MIFKTRKPMCWWCQHFDSANYNLAFTYRCAAFEVSIPAEIVRAEYDHREPHPEDNGLQFEPGDAESVMTRAIFRNITTVEDAETWLGEVLNTLDMGRALGGVLPPLSHDDQSS